MAHLLFEPIYQERVWGGRGLESQLGRWLPPGKAIGESWELVDRPEAMSTTGDGRTLRSLLASEGDSIMGPGWDPSRPFPILVKWLDCQDRLSLQVHPPAELAASLGGEPKSENWYIAAAQPGATLMAGLKQGVSRDDFEQALQANALEPLVHHLEVEAGNSIFIPSGRLHAIGGGNLILEIQQNSDTTYRVYDWGRVGLDGQPRQLHTEQSLRSINFEDYEPQAIPACGSDQLLAESEHFTVRRRQLRCGERLEFPAGQPRILSVVAGSLKAEDGSVIASSRNALLRAADTSAFESLEDSTLLVTENFH